MTELVPYKPPAAPAGERGTNPKDLFGVKKVPLSYVPPSSIIYEGLAFAEGGFKYDPYNWRNNKVIGSIYIAACFRHLFKYQDGEYTDPKSGVPHLGNAKACIGIIIDGHETGNLVDDRPPPGAAARLLDEFEPIIAHLQKMADAWRAQVAAEKKRAAEAVGPVLGVDFGADPPITMFDDSHMRPADALPDEDYVAYRWRKGLAAVHPDEKQRSPHFLEEPSEPRRESSRNPRDYNRGGTQS